MLSVRDRVLLGLAALGDVVTEVRRLGGLMEVTMQQVYGWVPEHYRKGTAQVAVWRMLQTGSLEKVVKGGEPYFRLTGTGVKRRVREFSLVRLQKRKWDRLWRIVIFDIPVTENRLRDRLREKLEELGFGMFQESVWMTPYDLARETSEFVEAKGLEEFVYVFVSPLEFVRDIEALVERIWKVEKINNLYQDLIDEWERRDASLSGEQLDSLVRGLCSSYLEIIAVDPFLPMELLPKDWAGDSARKLFKELNKFFKTGTIPG